MTREDIIRLALEALESCDSQHPSDGGRQWYDDKLVEPAIAALRAALAEPVQEPVQVQRNYLVIKNEFYGDPPAPHATWGAAMAAMLDAGVIKGLTISARDAK